MWMSYKYGPFSVGPDWHVGYGGHVAGAAEADLELGLHGRLVHAGERAPGVRRLELGRGDVSANYNICLH